MASGGPFVQRVTPNSPEETSNDASGKAGGIVETISATPTPTVPFAGTKPSAVSGAHSLRSGLQSYELPRRVSAKDVLNLWENGCDDFPPIKDWTPTQKLKQQSKISRWKKLVDIYKLDYHGDMKSFQASFSDARGEVLPVTTILSLYETQQTPAFLGKAKPAIEPGSFACGRDKSIQEDDDESEKPAGKCAYSECEDVESGEGSSEIKLADGNVTQASTEVRYYLPRKLAPSEIVRLWEEGCEEFPPVSQWSRAQKIGQETKIFRWRKIVEIFNKDCNRDWQTFFEKYANERGHLMAISSIIAKYDAENAPSGPIFDNPDAKNRLSSASGGQDSLLEEEKSPSSTANSLGNEEKVKMEGQGDGDKSHILPRKVTAKDIIRLWETGYGDLPPLNQWTPAQKASQRSKFSRWTKIYDIYKYHCKGDMSLFESKFSDERGELYPVTTIVAMFDAWESPSSLTTPFSTASNPGQKTGEESVTEAYQLPRKVTAKDVVRLWEEGCELFPPVSRWQKIHKVGHETKLFRWKKIVDIFRKDCSGSWEKFQERFSNTKGELLPVSAILAKYDLENETPSYFPKGFSLGLNSSSFAQKDVALTKLDGDQNENGNSQLQDKDTGSDSERADDEGNPLEKGSEFILPKKVTALDVIYLWENGLGDMPPLCQWTPSQKASQRSKISRWNKIVDIFKYECGGDIRKFEEKYRDEKGELLPITNILNLHDLQDKSLWSELKLSWGYICPPREPTVTSPCLDPNFTQECTKLIQMTVRLNVCWDRADRVGV